MSTLISERPGTAHSSSFPAKGAGKPNSTKKITRFWSSVEYTSIMSPIVREMLKIGHNAEHCFYIASSDYRKKRSKLALIWLRARMYIFYPIYLLLKELTSPSTYCVTCTNTFYAPFILSMLKIGKRRNIHLLYDLFPDALIITGKLSPTNPISHLVKWIVNATFAHSCANVILGERLKRHIANQLPPDRPNKVIPVGTDCIAFPSIISPIKLNKDMLEVLYCGNLGHLHEVNTLIDYFEHPRAQQPQIRFRFHGMGAGMKQLKQACTSNIVSFEKGLSPKEWSATMSNCAIGLVTMRPGAENVLLPSKTYSAMAAGQAILAICPRESDLADMINEHDCGWVIEPGDVDRLIKTINSIAIDQSELQCKRTNAQTAARAYYDAPPVAKQWHNLITELQRQKCPTL